MYMSIALTYSVAVHDDPTSVAHARDKTSKKERAGMTYKQTPALESVPGSRIVPGTFPSPVSGFSFEMKCKVAIRAKDGKSYTRAVLARSKMLSVYKYQRIRNERTWSETRRKKAGIDSLIWTLPPWSVGIISRIGPSEREHLMLFLAEHAAAVIQRVSGRPSFGGGVHLDTAVPHVHQHVEAVEQGTNGEPGQAYPKCRFLTTGKWTTGAYLINEKFPGLLSKDKLDMLNANIGRKDVPHLVDLQVAVEVSRQLETWVKDKGFLQQYNRDCEEYRRRKSRAQENERDEPLIRSALESFHETGIWPIFYRLMRLALWRMIPKALRKPIIASIRMYQIISDPVENISISISNKVTDMLKKRAVKRVDNLPDMPSLPPLSRPRPK